MEIVDARVSWKLGKGFSPVPLASGVAVPRVFRAFLTLENDLEVVMEVEVIDRVPRCVELTIKGSAVTTEDLRLPVQRLLDNVVASVAMPTSTANGVTTMAPPVTEDEVQRVVDASHTATRRRSLTDADLRRAADAYRSGGVVAVQAAMNVSEAQAYRYVRKAREAKFLEPRSR